MDFNIQQLISQYGYWAMLIGALIEGETFLIAGGVAAKHGLLSVPLLILIAWLGSMLHDIICFLLGRYAGHWVLGKVPRLKRKIYLAQPMLDKHGNKVVLLMRFVYGLRVVIPLAIGSMRGISTKRFICLDAIGGLVWSALFVMLGYVFGAVIDVILRHLSHYATHEVWWMLLAVLVLIVMVLLGIVWRRYRNYFT